MRALYDRSNMKHIESSILSFLQHSEANVLVLKGAWGVGKTFFWNNIVESKKEHINQKKYSYVSLFGLKGIEELQASIFYNSKDIDSNSTNNIKNNAKKVTSVLKSIPQISKYTQTISAIEKSLVNDFLICIDDLERKNTDLSIPMILGYISELSERKKCKIVLIFNEDTLSKDEQKEYSTYREKVVDVELEYAPDSKRNIDIIFSGHDSRKLIHDTLKESEVKNIRIIKHIKWVFEHFSNLVKDLESPVKKKYFQLQ